MEKLEFDMSDMKYGKTDYRMFLIKENEDLYLELVSEKETIKIKALHISKLKNITNFFYRGFGIMLKDMPLEEQLIDEEKLMERERKILIPETESSEVVTSAIEELKNKYSAKVIHANYQRVMDYVDTSNNDLQSNNIIFRLTQEENVVKSTIHMDNNLPGDQKHICKFFFNDTTLEEVEAFFEKALGVTPIKKDFKSYRTEFKCYMKGEKFELSLDTVPNGDNFYTSLEVECDNFDGAKEKDSKRVDEEAKEFAKSINLGNYEIVDLGTEAIDEKMTSKPFFETQKLKKVY